MKTLKLMMSLYLVFAMCGCHDSDAGSDEVVEMITISLKIVHESTETELFSGEISAEGSNLTLADVLLANAQTLQLESERGVYGMKIKGLMGVKTEDWNAGPWWVYSSSNNTSCVKAGYCDGASKLKVASGDEFTFTFSTGY